MVPEYNVTKTLKAFVGARSSQQNFGMNKPSSDGCSTVVIFIHLDGQDGMAWDLCGIVSVQSLK